MRTIFQEYIHQIMEKAVNNDDLDRIRYRLAFDTSLSEEDYEFLYKLTLLVGAWYNSRERAKSATNRRMGKYECRRTKGRYEALRA